MQGSLASMYVHTLYFNTKLHIELKITGGTGHQVTNDSQKIGILIPPPPPPKKGIIFSSIILIKTPNRIPQPKASFYIHDGIWEWCII